MSLKNGLQIYFLETEVYSHQIDFSIENENVHISVS